MTPHDCRGYVEGCYRCDLSRDEAERIAAEERALIVGVLAEHRETWDDLGNHDGCTCCGLHTWSHSAYREHVARLILEALGGAR